MIHRIQSISSYHLTERMSISSTRQVSHRFEPCAHIAQGTAERGSFGDLWLLGDWGPAFGGMPPAQFSRLARSHFQ